MSKCIIIPEKILRQALKQYKEETGKDFSCVWPQDSDFGVYLQDFKNHIKLDYQNTYLLLAQLFEPFGYDIRNCDAIYYTTSKLLIVIWKTE